MRCASATHLCVFSSLLEWGPGKVRFFGWTKEKYRFLIVCFQPIGLLKMAFYFPFTAYICLSVYPQINKEQILKVSVVGNSWNHAKSLYILNSSQAVKADEANFPLDSAGQFYYDRGTAFFKKRRLTIQLQQACLPCEIAQRWLPASLLMKGREIMPTRSNFNDFVVQLLTAQQISNPNMLAEPHAPVFLIGEVETAYSTQAWHTTEVQPDEPLQDWRLTL